MIDDFPRAAGTVVVVVTLVVVTVGCAQAASGNVTSSTIRRSCFISAFLATNDDCASGHGLYVYIIASSNHVAKDRAASRINFCVVALDTSDTAARAVDVIDKSLRVPFERDRAATITRGRFNDDPAGKPGGAG